MVFYGTDLNPDQITLSGTTDRSSLLINATHSETTTVGDIQINGDLKSLTAPQVTLDGNLTVTGNLTTGILGAASNGAATINGASTIRSFFVGQASTFNLTTAAPVRVLSADEWTGSSTITAPSISTLKVGGNFSAQLLLSNSALALNSAVFGSLLVGNPWSIAGSVKTLSAGSVAPGFAATIGGNIASLNIAANLAGNFTAGSITNLKVRGNLSAATINLTNTTGTDLQSLTVGGAISASDIFSAANIDTIRATILDNSEIFAGVVSGVSGLPVSASDFASAASIGSVTVTGSHNQFAVTDSDIAAANLGKIAFGTVQIDNGSTPFGLAADQLASFSRIVTGRRFIWKSANGLSNLTHNGDLTENIFS